MASADPLQEEKVAAFRECVNKYRLEGTVCQIQGLESQDGYLAARSVLVSAATRPTALISGSYDLTRGILQAVQELGLRVPEDLSVVSYDQTPEMVRLKLR